MSPDTQMHFYGELVAAPPTHGRPVVTDAMIKAADEAIPFLPMEKHRRLPAIRMMLEAALGAAWKP